MTMNSANVVGFDNFFGLDNRRHRMHSAVLGLEAFKSRPGGLRFEAGALDAWFTSNRQNFNQSNINDAERNRGYSARLLAKNKSERARLDGGFTRSYFYNPDDPLLNQGAAVQSSRAETRSARYVDAGYDLFKDFVFKRAPAPSVADGAQTAPAQQDASQPAVEPKKFNLTVNFRHERVDPLFRSIGASTQADLFRNEAEFVGSYGELNFTAAHARFNDNLAGIRTILRTQYAPRGVCDQHAAARVVQRRPAHGAQSVSSASRLHIRARAGVRRFHPHRRRVRSAGRDPRSGEHRPIVHGRMADQGDQAGLSFESFAAGQSRFGTRTRRSAELHAQRDSRMESAATLELNFDLNFEDANNREQARTDRNLRFGATANWRQATRQTFNLTLSTTGAGDLARTARNFNNEFDLQWAYRLTRENENRFKKFQAITSFATPIASRGRGTSWTTSINLTKLQTFNTGLNFIFF